VANKRAMETTRTDKRDGCFYPRALAQKGERWPARPGHSTVYARMHASSTPVAVPTRWYVNPTGCTDNGDHLGTSSGAGAAGEASPGHITGRLTRQIDQR
jgi:hypothetical protein